MIVLNKNFLNVDLIRIIQNILQGELVRFLKRIPERKKHNNVTYF